MGATAATAKSLPITKRGDRLLVELANSAAAVREAQVLRYQIFAEELGAQLDSAHHGIDCDEFDTACHHLLVRETHTGRLIGCTRLLTGAAAQQLGSFYSAHEFDLGQLLLLPGQLLEVGRTCIAADYRQGAAIAVLWSGLASFIQTHQIDYLFGCASMSLGDNDVQAAAMMNRLRRHAMSDAQLRVIPHYPLLSTAEPEEILDAPLPPLLKAYVRLGAKACGEPCRDAAFGVADVLMLLDVRDLNPVYARHFLERTGTLRL
ncbi:GNAT family N-acetyltransferase [Rhodoferax sp. 4810]|uniref:L-ornithine N(alpha)-acyltransferase n=1 Tax=Thiospirillum jenense TaxID=1653858 RepID=A0A839HIK4_9GAMM|nr:GNAT family N-acyltransferase [Thiospirillum jenense]MBB1075811.1 GNAT family N-acetyltransferase [Rhodoferax jenense]MBB1126886.1 GNAT family N-acetyltransferase [Thiospirillum jenense]